MSKSRRRLLALWVLGAVALVAVAGLRASPLEGPISHAIVTGASMEPALTAGDLVVVRERAGYGPGDDNDFLDPGRPRADEVIGSAWLTVPHAGRVLEHTRQPWLVGLMVGAIALVPVSRRRRRGRGPERGGGPRPHEGRRARALLLAATAVLVPSLLLGAIALARPASESREIAGAYRHTGEFGYSARALPGAAYAGDTVDAGDALFVRLVDDVRVRFRYALVTALPHELDGTASLSAEVSDGAGWSRTIPIARSTPFRGDEVTVAGGLDLDALGRLVRAFEREVDASNPSYRVTVTPRIEVSGGLGGATVADAFAPPLVLQLDADRLRVAELTDGAEAGANALEREGTIRRTEPNEIGLPGLSLDVRPARALAAAGAALALALLVLVGRPALRRVRRDESFRIELRYPGRLVEATPAPSAGAGAGRGGLDGRAGAAGRPLRAGDHARAHRGPPPLHRGGRRHDLSYEGAPLALDAERERGGDVR